MKRWPLQQLVSLTSWAQRPEGSENRATSPAEIGHTDLHVECEDLSLAYRDHVVFNDVSLAIKTGRITAVIGPSGCGKSSFLSCFNRLTDLVPGCRVSGRLVIGGADVLDPETDVLSLRRRVGMIFQKPNPFPLSIHRNFDLPLRQHGVRSRAEREVVLEAALRDVGLWDEVKDRLHKPAAALSGGQQQRMCIARALALKPEIVLFDEPCSALDPISSAVVEDLITELRERYTVVIVTHNLQQARRIADRVAFFWMVDGRGRLVEHGPCRQVFEEPREELTAAYVRGARG